MTGIPEVHVAINPLELIVLLVAIGAMWGDLRMQVVGLRRDRDEDLHRIERLEDQFGIAPPPRRAHGRRA